MTGDESADVETRSLNFCESTIGETVPEKKKVDDSMPRLLKKKPVSVKRSAQETEDARPTPKKRRRITLRRVVELLRDEGGVMVHNEIRRIVKNGDQAIILSQIIYWMSPGASGSIRAKARFNEKRFVALTHEALGSQVGMSARRVKTCLGELKKVGLVEIEHHRWNGVRCSYIRPVAETIYDLLGRTERPSSNEIENTNYDAYWDGDSDRVGW